MTAKTPDPAEQRTDLEKELDGLSLQQALLDFEVANARVMDLTQRLVEATATITDFRSELEQLRIEHAELRAIHQRMQSSHAYRLADRIWNVRNALGV